MRLIFLGTGAGAPSAGRTVSAAVLDLRDEKSGVWLFDCGEGTQMEMRRNRIPMGAVNRIFITHMHGDHVYGLPGLLASRSLQDGQKKLHLYGPHELLPFLQDVFRHTSAHAEAILEFHAMEDGLSLLVEDRFHVVVRELEHRVTCYGYRIEEMRMNRRLRLDVLTQLGVRPGPVYGLLQRGTDVELDDGRLISADEVTEREAKARVVAILGDTRPCDAGRELASFADLLVHEATYADREAAQAVAYFHSTAGEAARIAADAHARRLVLTHISARYREDDLPGLELEAKAVFPNTTTAYDGFSLPIAPHERGMPNP